MKAFSALACFRMPADVVKAGLRQVGIEIAGEGRLAVLPDRLVDVHARAVVAEDRLRHERGRLAVGGGNLVHRILVDLHLVGLTGQGVELHAELMLGSRPLRGGAFSTSMPISAITVSISEAVVLALVDRRPRGSSRPSCADGDPCCRPRTRSRGWSAAPWSPARSRSCTARWRSGRRRRTKNSASGPTKTVSPTPSVLT